jgi:hypothetical protein
MPHEGACTLRTACYSAAPGHDPRTPSDSKCEPGSVEEQGTR